MKRSTLVVFILIIMHLHVIAQSVSSSLPGKPDTRGNYLFYLHGGVVSVKGNNGINDAAPEWGPYEYANILDSLAARGFHVISEIRHADAADSVYAEKIVTQVDSLFAAGISGANIMVVGASSGWGVALIVSSMIADHRISYVLMGGCWPKDFISMKLHGRFLSVIESTDPHGTCAQLFQNQDGIAWEEVTLHTGLSHGFFYKGRKVWIDPVVSWFGKNRNNQ